MLLIIFDILHYRAQDLGQADFKTIHSKILSKLASRVVKYIYILNLN